MESKEVNKSFQENIDVQDLKELEFPHVEESMANSTKMQTQNSEDDQSQLTGSHSQLLQKPNQKAKIWSLNIKALSSKKNVKSHSPNFQKEQSTSCYSLQSLQQIIQKANEFINSIIKHENTVVFFGFSKSGKSTLMNYIIGNELIGMRKNRFSKVGITTVNKSNGPEIGLESESKTILPTRWENLKDLPQLALVDTPGFEDNRSSIQDIQGAYYIYEVFQNVKSVKIVLVVDINDIISDRINAFLTILHTVENILNGTMVDCFSSIIVIFTKVPDKIYDSPANKEFICEIMEEKILSDSNMEISDTVKKFVQYLITNNENIGLFMQASKEGPITNEIEIDIFEAIKNANSIGGEILKSVTPCIADKSKVFLYTISEKLLFKKHFTEFQSAVNNILHTELNEFSKILISSTSKPELVSIKNKLSNKKNEVDNLFDIEAFHEKIIALRNINPTIKSKIDDHQLIEISKLMKFVDALLKTKESEQFDLTFQHILRNVAERIDSMSIQLKLKLNEINQHELQNLLEKLEKDHSLKMEQLKIETEKVTKYNEDLKFEMRRLIRKNQELEKEKEESNNCTIL